MSIASRLHAQQLLKPRFSDPLDLVRFMGAMQGQDFAAVKWAVAMRLKSPLTDEQVEARIDDGSLVRIHAMRFTWQLIARDDVRWILDLLAPRILNSSRGRYAQLGLDGKTLDRCVRAIERALRDTESFTRSELNAVLTAQKIPLKELRLAYVLGFAELTQRLVGTARKGKEPCWTLFDRVVPAAKHAPTDGLRELARRYMASRGHATVADFAWWAGVPQKEAKVALEGIAPPRAPSSPSSGRSVHLIPAFDEYIVSHKDRSLVLAVKAAELIPGAGGGMLAPCVLVGGTVVGTWKRTLTARTVRIEVTPLPGLRPPNIDAEAARYGAFLGRSPDVAFMRSTAR